MRGIGCLISTIPDYLHLVILAVKLVQYALVSLDAFSQASLELSVRETHLNVVIDSLPDSFGLRHAIDLRYPREGRGLAGGLSDSEPHGLRCHDDSIAAEVLSLRAATRLSIMEALSSLLVTGDPQTMHGW
jgi:hypothetical protein